MSTLSDRCWLCRLALGYWYESKGVCLHIMSPDLHAIDYTHIHTLLDVNVCLIKEHASLHMHV